MGSKFIFDKAKVLRKIQYIFTQIEDFDYKVKYGRMRRGTTFPYVAYFVNSPLKNEGNKFDFILDINMWDNKGDNIAELLEMSNEIQGRFNDLTCNDNDMSLVCRVETAQEVPDVEEQIRREEIRVLVEYRNNNV